MDYRNLQGLPRRFFLAAIVFALAASAAHLATAQSFDATNLHGPTDLAATWLVKAGDDPAYASQDYDDSQWKRFDPTTDIKTILGKSRPSVIWYRLHVKVNPAETGLVLREWNMSHAFEIYVNGERLIASGRVAPHVLFTSTARLLKPIPDRMLATGTLVIAMRVYIAQTEWATDQDPGFFATNLTLGQQSALYTADWLGVIGENAFNWLDWSLEICLGIVALVLFSAQRNQSEYLWIFALGMLRLAELPEPVISVFYNIPIFWQVLTDLLRVATPYIWASLYFAFVHQRIGWRWRAFLIFAGVLNAVSALQGLVFILPLQILFISNLPFIILLTIVMPVVMAVHLRRGNREAGILLIPMLLFSLYLYAEIGLEILFQFPAWRAFALNGLNLIDRFPAGPFALSLNSVSDILATLALAIIMVLRFTTMSRRQAMLDSELAAAREVQAVLVPAHGGLVPGFTVESVYEPAQQVGGDFFQIIPAGEGGLLVVVGDVAGKGLPAAMLVSVLVGAICGLSEYTQDPAEMLQGLNERLVGRAGGGFSTALAVYIASDGRVIIANAGHLSPYLDGREVELPGALPLGVAKGAAYETIEFRLEPGSKLTFYSDGVIEAQNQKGEMFGFDRGRELSTQPAAAIAQAAKEFGQQDDITVVTIERDEAVAAAA